VTENSSKKHTKYGALHECYKDHSLKRTVEKWQTKIGKMHATFTFCAVNIWLF